MATVLPKVCCRCKVLTSDFGRKGNGHKSECRTCIKKINKENYGANLDHCREKSREYARLNYQKCKARRDEWRRRNAEKSREQQRNYAQAARVRNPNFSLSHNLRNRILQVLNGLHKSAATFEMLGCTLEQFKTHMESKFTAGMTWENHGTSWHVDHIRPCASFDLADPEQQKVCFHYSNLQPLGRKDNLYWGDVVYKKGKWKPGYPNHLKTQHGIQDQNC